MNSIADAIVYAVAYIHTRDEREEFDDDDNDESAIAHIMTYLSHATPEEEDALGYDILLPIPPHFVSFAWRDLGFHSLFSFSAGRVRCQSLELVTRYLQPGARRGAKKEGLSQVPGEPRLSVRHVPIRLRRDCLR